MTGIIVIYGLVVAWYIYSDILEKRTRKHRNYTQKCRPPALDAEDFVIDGRKAPISRTDIEEILDRRYPFFRGLAAEDRSRFLLRTERFMRDKVFIVKDDEAFREMPVLVSASAVHLTLGMRDYKLPFYRYIRIYPQEYFAGHGFRVLAGNVEDNTITVAWNHFLQGFHDPRDGSNVGLHEMSHALYIQKMVIDEDHAPTFGERYRALITECRTAFDAEMKGHIDLYSDYATTDMQEFWAESVELFFEKPGQLQLKYPAVFRAMKELLNQDPLNAEQPVLHHPRSFRQRMLRLSRAFFAGRVFGPGKAQRA
ncbi:MAG TPA: zinc-dependent peptidase [Flavisolibacter sp.]